MLKSNPKDFTACMKEMEEAVVKSLKWLPIFTANCIVQTA
jgi:hypothetical protein